MNSIEIKNLTFGDTEFPVLEEVDFTVKKGELISIVGGNGSGKSTLIKNILGELTPDSGRVKILGKDIKEYTSYRKIGYVPQLSIVEKIAFPITVLELVVLNLYEDFGFIKIPRKKHLKKAKAVLKDLGLEKYSNRPVNELSGGLQQRAMIARTLVVESEVLILDEPTAGIDKKNRKSFIQLLERLNKEKEMTILLITHELEEVLETIELSNIYEVKDKKIRQIEKEWIPC